MYDFVDISIAAFIINLNFVNQFFTLYSEGYSERTPKNFLSNPSNNNTEVSASTSSPKLDNAINVLLVKVTVVTHMRRVLALKRYSSHEELSLLIGEGPVITPKCPEYEITKLL